MRFSHCQVVICFSLLVWPMWVWGDPSASFRGTGEFGGSWRADPMHGYWDPLTYPRPASTKVKGVFQGEECLECHATLTPGIVQDWRASRHAKGNTPVYCSSCHGQDHEKLFFPTPATCGQCHPQRLAQMEDEKRYGFPSHALAMERVVDSKHFADKPKAEVAACLQCHSVATKCDSCHTRHRFSAAEARRPEACVTCHSGPPHPDDVSYFASPHGMRYLKEGRGWDWSKPLGHGNYPVPTCAGCHMKDGNHQVADKAVWKFGIREINPKTSENRIKRHRWVQVCGDCHPHKVVNRFFLSLDEERKSAWRKLYTVEKILKNLRADALLQPAAGDRPPYPMDWLANWFPKERIGYYEGQASAFYNVGAIERDYFDLWYFTNPGAYKGMAHGAIKIATRFHGRMVEESHAIAVEASRLRTLGKLRKEVDVKPLWMEGEYTIYNREHH